MLARRAAREIALILFSQLEEDVKKYATTDFDQIIVNSVRTLTNNAYEELKLQSTAGVDMIQYIDEYEANHPTNLSRPIESNDIPVPIPLTSDMTGCFSIAEITDAIYRNGYKNICVAIIDYKNSFPTHTKKSLNACVALWKSLGVSIFDTIDEVSNWIVSGNHDGIFKKG